MKFFLFFTLTLVFFSCEEILLENDISQEPVILLSPSNGVIVQSESINFNWESLEGATSYQLQVAFPNFENSQRIELDTTTTNLQFTKRLIDSVYQWRVRGINSAYQSIYSTSSFTIE